MADPHDNSLGRRLLDLAGRHPRAFFLALGALFCSPLLFGYAFLPISYLALTPLWYDPAVVPSNYDLLDAAIYQAPLDEFFKSQLRQGVFPFWNPYNLGGIPMAFNGQSGLFYPVKIALIGMFPVWLAEGLSQWLHLSVAGMAAFALARRMDLGLPAGLFMGIAWAWNGFLSGWLELGFIANCAVWTPLLVLAALAALDSWKAVPAMAVALAALVISAHLQFVIYFALFGLVVGLRLAGSWTVARGARFLSGAGLGLGLALPYLVPSAILMSASQRPVMKSDFLLSTYRQFLAGAPATAVLPDLFGNPADLFAWTRISGAGNFIYPETVMYLGIIPLLFALAAATHRQGRFYLGAGLLALVLPATPVYLLLARLPAINHLSSVRWVGLVHLFLVVAAAHGFDGWLRGQFPRRAYHAMLLLAGWAVASTMAILSGGWQAAASKGLRLPETGFYLDRTSYLAAVRRGFEACYSLSNPNFLLPLALLVALGWLLANPRRFAPLMLLLTALDLASFSYRFNPVEPASGLFTRNAVIDFLTHNTGDGRVAGLGTVKPNTLQPFAVADVGGYDSFYPVDSAIYMETLLGQADADGFLPGQVLVGERPPPPLLDHLNVKYLIGRPGGLVPSLPLVHSQGLPIYEFPGKVPRAGLYAQARLTTDAKERMRALLDPRFPRREVVLVEQEVTLDAGATGQAAVTGRSANEVTVKCQSSGRMLLVLNDAWCSGWQATVNGQPRPILKANQMFRAVLVEAGESTVVFRFHPPGWPLAIPLFFVSLLLSAGLALKGRRAPVAKVGQ